jgi:hypothetical protein
VRVQSKKPFEKEEESPTLPDLQNPFKPLEAQKRKGSTAFLDAEVLRFLSSSANVVKTN